MEIINCDESHYAQWDTYVLNHPVGSIFQTTKWLSKYQTDVILWIYQIKGEIKGGFCTLITSKNRIKGYHIPPYTHIHGPLHNNNFSREAELFTVHLLKKLKGHIDFKFLLAGQNIVLYNEFGFEQNISVSYRLEYETIDQYFQNLNKNKYRELKKLLIGLEGKRIIVHNNLTFNDVNLLLEETGNRGGFDAKLDMVENLFFKGNQSMVKIFGFEVQNEGIVSVVVLVEDNNCVYNIVNASKRLEHKEFKTINLLSIYKSIEYAIDHKKVFDFEGSMISGIAKFYKLMGGEQTAFIRIQKSPSLVYSFYRALKQMKNDRK